MSLPAIVTRLVGLWILAGAFLKLFQGSPADLPEALRDLPLDTGLVFKLAISGELAVGLLAVLRPSRGWLPVKLLTLAFLVVLVTQIAGGEPSCGCFGAAVTISPTIMLVIDAIAFLALVLVRPWRQEPGRLEAPWVVALLVIAGCLVLPWVLDREVTTEQIAAGGTSSTDWTYLRPDTWKGKPLAETALWPLLQPKARIPEGAIILWRESCEDCAEHLQHVDPEGQFVVLVQLAKEFDDEKVVVKHLPSGPNVFRQMLPKAKYYDMPTPPVHLEITDGVITGYWEGRDALEHFDPFK